MITIKDIALKVKKDIATVSRTLNNLPGVGEETRALIKKVAHEAGYRKHATARNLAMQKTNNIGLVILSAESVSHPYFAEVTRGVESISRTRNYNLQLATASLHHYEKTHDLFDLPMFTEQCVDGAIIFVPSLSIQEVISLQEIGFPFVLINDQLPELKVYSVGIDFKEGMKKLTNYLITLGHHRIGFIGGSAYGRGEIAKEAGYREALDDNGIKPDQNLIQQGNYIRPDVEKIVKEILSLPEKVTAIMASDDEMAVWSMQVIRTHGLKIPEDISVTGFNDMPIASSIYPGLTTIHAPMYETGEKAARHLFNLIDKKEISHNIVLKTKLVIRGSCRRID